MKSEDRERRAGRPGDDLPKNDPENRSPGANPSPSASPSPSVDPIDDPRLTAFALGELDDADDRAAMGSLVAASPEARRAVDDIRVFAGDLERELASEPMPEASVSAESSVAVAGTDASEARSGFHGFPASGVVRWAIAASLIAAASFGAWWIADGPRRSERGAASDAPAHARLGLDDLSKRELALEDAEVDADGAERAATSAELQRLRSLGYLNRPVPGRGGRLGGDAGAAGETRRSGGDAVAGSESIVDAEEVAPADRVENSVYRFEASTTATGGKENDISGSADWLLGRKKDAFDKAVLRVEAERSAAEAKPTLGAEVRVLDELKKAPAERARLEALGYIEAPAVAERLRRATESRDVRTPSEPPSTESYDAIEENDFIAVSQDPLSTFSIDVDTASYSNVRRMLRAGQMPPPGAVRLEEMINYFSYDYPLPDGSAPFSASLEVADCPWAPEHRLVRVALQGRRVPREERPPLNLVFLLDVSGSMSSQDKLPLVKESLGLLVDELRPDDRVAIAVYAGASGLVLDSTPGSRRGEIRGALDRLKSGGSTNGGGGLRLAYEVARRHRVDGGANRVILCTDGDFNVGTTNESELVSLVQENAKTGVYLTVLGFGTGNLKDSLLEAISAKGDGTYGYIDSRHEARKVFVDHASGTLVPIANDVKIQVEFNPLEVGSFRLLGYENRKMAHQDFRDDEKDAGEIGAGHTVTAFYEVVPVGASSPAVEAEPLTYQRPGEPSAAAFAGELLTLRVRYKSPDSPQAAAARRNGVFDEPEPYTDVDASGTYDPGEPFDDRNRNGAYDHGDAYTDVNGNGRYDLGEPYRDASVAPPIAASRELSFPLTDGGMSFAGADEDFKFASAVVGFGMLLRRSEYAGPLNYDLVEELVRDGMGEDRYGYRAEFLELVGLAKGLAENRATNRQR